jgi:histidinol-phosphatase (PHP family)
MFDTHIHTTAFSTDAKMSAEAALARARKMGLGIIVTEHLDLDYPENPEAFLFDFADYFRQLGAKRAPDFLLGLELGLRPDCAAQNRDLVRGWPFDEIIGSVHVVKGVDIYGDTYTKDKSKEEAYRLYLTEMLHSIESFQDFDTLGHVDYISRYAVYDDPEITLRAFGEEWSAICRVLVTAGKALEINTRRLGNAAAQKALSALLSRYRELGGRYVTLGSDAHKEESLGYMLDYAWDMAEALSLQPVYFRKRQLVPDRR